MLKSLSQSKIRTWLNCKAEYYLKYELGIYLYNPNFEAGTAYHAAVEDYHHGRPYDAELIKAYTEQFKPADVIATEVKFRTTFKHPETGESLAVPFSGIIDHIRKNGRLADLKTSQVSWSQNRADGDIQPTAYLFHQWQTTGKLEPFEFVIARKNWDESKRYAPLQVVSTERTLTDFASLWNLCYRIIEDISKEMYWDCSCKSKEHLMGVTA